MVQCIQSGSHQRHKNHGHGVRSKGHSIQFHLPCIRSWYWIVSFSIPEPEQTKPLFLWNYTDSFVIGARSSWVRTTPNKIEQALSPPSHWDVQLILTTSQMPVYILQVTKDHSLLELIYLLTEDDALDRIMLIERAEFGNMVVWFHNTIPRTCPRGRTERKSSCILLIKTHYRM